MKPVIIFDFDGTIADTLPHVIEVLQSFSPKYGYKRLSADEIERLQEYSIREIFKIAGIPFYRLPFIVSDVQQAMSTKMSFVKPIQGIVPEIHSLKKEGYALGLVTSSKQEVVYPFLQKNKLDIFDYVYTGTTLFGKARVIQKLLDKYALSKDHIVYIGDEVRDIEATQKIKIPIIAVTWGYNSKKGLVKYNPSYLIDKPEELAPVLQKIFL